MTTTNRFIIRSMKNIQGALRLTGFDKPTVWTIMTPLAIKTESANLGQGFPSWQPPEFYQKFLNQAISKSNHQYVRAFGSLNYVKAIAEFHKKSFGTLDPENDIVTVNGGVQGLFSCIIGLVNQGDQVLVFDPSYDCYRPQVQMAGGKTIGIPLQPKKSHTKAELWKRIENGIVSSQEDDWEIDFQLFEKSINAKTKMLILNTPHNPSGKVFTELELARIAEILEKHPQVVVVEDNVYEGMTFDEYFNKPLPKLSFQKGMANRTLSIYSAGKIFAATGVRSGWVIGPSYLIKSVRSVHQYNVFCSYNVIENTLANSLTEITQPTSTYIQEYATRLTNHRNILIKELLNSKFDFDLWIPKGGYFIICDISKVEVMEKYYTDEQGNRRTKDYAFAYQLAYENRVVCIPCSPFYGQENQHLGSRYVRFAFCKDEELIREAGRRLQL